MSGWQGVLSVLGLALLTVATRGFFLFPRREVPIPTWLRQGMRYAPIAALAAVIAPEVLTTQGHLISTFKDARLYAAAAATAYFFWRRDILGTIVVGTLVMVGLSVGLGW